MTQQYLAPPHPTTQPAPPPRQHYVAEPRRRTGVSWVVAVTALAVALAALAVGGVALIRQPEAPAAAAPAPTPTAPAPPSPADLAVAKKEACDAWIAASPAMVSAREAFISSPPNWNDPVTVSSLVQAQAGILAQVEYLREHVPSETPAELAAPIRDYVAAHIDIIALDGQHQQAAAVNAAANRSNAAAAKIRAACGVS